MVLAQSEVRLDTDWVDYLILLIYFVAVLGIGFAAKRYIKTSLDYFLSGRSLPAWITGLAFISANLGALEILGMAANGAQFGVCAVPNHRPRGLARVEDRWRRPRSRRSVIPDDAVPASRVRRIRSRQWSSHTEDHQPRNNRTGWNAATHRHRRHRSRSAHRPGDTQPVRGDGERDGVHRSLAAGATHKCIGWRRCIQRRGERSHGGHLPRRRGPLARHDPTSTRPRSCRDRWRRPRSRRSVIPDDAVPASRVRRIRSRQWSSHTEDHQPRNNRTGWNAATHRHRRHRSRSAHRALIAGGLHPTLVGGCNPPRHPTLAWSDPSLRDRWGESRTPLSPHHPLPVPTFDLGPGSVSRGRTGPQARTRSARRSGTDGGRARPRSPPVPSPPRHRAHEEAHRGSRNRPHQSPIGAPGRGARTRRYRDRHQGPVHTGSSRCGRDLDRCSGHPLAHHPAVPGRDDRPHPRPRLGVRQPRSRAPGPRPRRSTPSAAPPSSST